MFTVFLFDASKNRTCWFNNTYLTPDGSNDRYVIAIATVNDTNEILIWHTFEGTKARTLKMTKDLPPSTIRMHATSRAVCYIYDKDFLHFQVFDLLAACSTVWPTWLQTTVLTFLLTSMSSNRNFWSNLYWLTSLPSLIFHTLRLRLPRENVMMWLSSGNPKGSVLLGALPWKRRSIFHESTVPLVSWTRRRV